MTKRKAPMHRPMHGKRMPAWEKVSKNVSCSFIRKALTDFVRKATTVRTYSKVSIACYLRDFPHKKNRLVM